MLGPCLWVSTVWCLGTLPPLSWSIRSNMCRRSEWTRLTQSFGGIFSESDRLCRHRDRALLEESCCGGNKSSCVLEFALQRGSCQLGWVDTEKAFPRVGSQMQFSAPAGPFLFTCPAHEPSGAVCAQSVCCGSILSPLLYPPGCDLSKKCRLSQRWDEEESLNSI